MKINQLSPSGYCKGVENAINTLERVAKNPKYPKPIYVLGEIVHNSFVTKHFNTLGVINITDDFESAISNINSGTIVITAHGISKNIVNILKLTSLTIVNTTCPYVTLVHKKIEKMIENGYSCLYIGHIGHPETNGVLGIDTNIKLVTNDNVDSIIVSSNENIFVSNQTTFSYFEIEDIVKKLKLKKPNLLFDNDICDESTKRQLAVKNQDSCDLTIIVGDKKSSNSIRLFETSKNAGFITIMISSFKDLDLSHLKGVKTINIIGGASTPQLLIDEIINHIKDL